MLSNYICSSDRKVWHCKLKRRIDFFSEFLQVKNCKIAFLILYFAKCPPPLTPRRETELKTESLKYCWFYRKLLRKNYFLIQIFIFILFIGFNLFFTSCVFAIFITAMLTRYNSFFGADKVPPYC